MHAGLPRDVLSLFLGFLTGMLSALFGIGVLLFSVILLLGRRQLHLARRAEQRNLRLLGGDGPP